jgi:hypothetical protein
VFDYGFERSLELFSGSVARHLTTTFHDLTIGNGCNMKRRKSRLERMTLLSAHDTAKLNNK